MLLDVSQSDVSLKLEILLFEDYEQSFELVEKFFENKVGNLWLIRLYIYIYKHTHAGHIYWSRGTMEVRL